VFCKPFANQRGVTGRDALVPPVPISFQALSYLIGGAVEATKVAVEASPAVSENRSSVQGVSRRLGGRAQWTAHPAAGLAAQR